MPSADNIRKYLKGNCVTFVASYYLNYTNVCAASCPLCAFYRKGNDADAFTLSTEQIFDKELRIAIKEMGSYGTAYSRWLSSKVWFGLLREYDEGDKSRIS